MITVANRTETAARVKYAFDHNTIRIDELCDPERILHIDSKVLDEAEAQDEPAKFDEPPLRSKQTKASAEEDEDENGTSPQKKLTKKEQAELLRKTVDTVGRQGQPGEQIQNVISVGMLSEGWDAKTVTHIMGLRAFTSQLLCEQVVGRGLRRTSYEVDREDRAVRAGIRQHLRRAVHLSAPRRRRRRSAATARHRKTRIEPVPSGGAVRDVLAERHSDRPRISPALTLDTAKIAAGS